VKENLLQLQLEFKNIIRMSLSVSRSCHLMILMLLLQKHVLADYNGAIVTSRREYETAIASLRQSA
jgi:hypothetical protein